MPHSNIDSDLLALLDEENNGSDQEMGVTSSRNRTKSGNGSSAHNGNSAANGHGSGGNSSRDDTPGGSQHASGGRAIEVDEEDEDDEEEEDDDDDGRHRRSSKKRPSKRSGGRSEKKRRRIRSATDLAAEREIDEEDEEDENPYPLEGMFRDEDDRERLMQMNELQREAELEGRREEIKRLTDRLALKKLLEKQQGGPGAGTTSSRRAATKPRSRPPRRSRAASDDDSEEDEEEDEDEEDEDEAEYSSSRRGARSSIASAAKSRKRSSVGASSTKATALNNLVQRRKELAKGVRSGLNDDDDDDFHTGTKVVGSSDEEAEDSDAYEDARSGRSKRGKRGFSSGGRSDADDMKMSKKDGNRKSPWSGSKEPPTQRLLGLYQITRNTIGEMLHRPDWLAYLPGNYVRFQWQPEKNEKGEMVAPVRIHEILEAKLDGSHYEITPGKPCNLGLRLEWGTASRWVRADAISNKPFHESEYQRWIIRLNGASLKYPSKDQLDNQQLKMDQFHTRRLEESEIQAIVDAKAEAKKKFKEKKEKMEKANASLDGTPNGNSQSQASEAASSQSTAKVPPLPSSGASALTDPSGKPGIINAAAVSHYDQATMLEMNERNRRADRERIKEAERRQAAAKRAAMGLAPNGPTAAAPGGRVPPLSSSGIGTPLKTESLSRSSTPAPGTLAASAPSVTKGQKGATNVVLSLDVDLGDF